MADAQIEGSLGEPLGDPDAHLFSPDGNLVDIAGAHGVLNEIEPLDASPERTAFNEARDAVVKCRATPEQRGLVGRAERLKLGLGRLQDNTYIPQT